MFKEISGRDLRSIMHCKKGNKCNLFTCFNGGCRDISVFSMGN